MSHVPVPESPVVEHITVCDACGGVIPDGAAHIGGVNGTLYLGGQATGFQNLDFCCTAHMGAWIGSRPLVPAPDPPYQPPAQ